MKVHMQYLSIIVMTLTPFVRVSIFSVYICSSQAAISL